MGGRWCRRSGQSLGRAPLPRTGTLVALLRLLAEKQGCKNILITDYNWCEFHKLKNDVVHTSSFADIDLFISVPGSVSSLDCSNSFLIRAFWASCWVSLPYMWMKSPNSLARIRLWYKTWNDSWWPNTGLC